MKEATEIDLEPYFEEKEELIFKLRGSPSFTREIKGLMTRAGGSYSALVRLGRGHKFFSTSIAAILRSVIMCNYDA